MQVDYGVSLDCTWLMSEEDFQPHTPPTHPPSVEQDNDDEVWDQLAMAVAEQAERGHMTHGVKRPAERYEQEEEEMELPDLDAFFDGYGFSNIERVQLCRTYANHLSARLRAVKKRL